MKFISTGLVSDSLLALREIKSFSCGDIENFKKVHSSHGVDIDNILSFLKNCGWICLFDDKKISLTESGVEVASLFYAYEIGEKLWEKILETYIFLCKPVWASLIPSGRERAYIYMPADAKNCFLEAGLMVSPPNQDVIDWWDRISAEIRKEHNLNLEMIGREGEKLTVEYEKQRTGKMPVWKSLDTNCVGFDIISCVDSISDTRLLLEVKSSTQPLEEAGMIISRNEWKNALLAKETSMYLFYVWEIGSVKRLAKLSVKDIEPHAPKDQGAGSWQEFKVPYNLFKEKFEIVESVGI